MNINKKLNLIYKYLEQNKFKIALAESVTAGKISDYLCRISGISNYFYGSYIVYSKISKKNMLGVEAKKSVSEETSIKLVRNLKKKTNADICLAITGYANSDNSLNHGIFFISLIIKDKTINYKSKLEGKRNQNREKMAKIAIDLLYKALYNL